MKNISSKSNKSGFTLVELLIVIAVLGVLAAVVLVAIDPLEQLARGRDAGRKSSVAQLGHALQAYFTAHGSAYPAAVANWITNTMVASGEIKTAPTNPSTFATACSTVAPAAVSENDFCYSTGTGGVTGGVEAVVYTQLESKSDRSKCGSLTTPAFYTYATVVGRAGIICGTAVTGDTAVAGYTGMVQ
jgi:prepilin-type N-terminal cleavage/methylation domain-containing protein